MIIPLVVLFSQPSARPSHGSYILAIDYLPGINVRLIIGSDIDVDGVVLGNAICPSHLIDDTAIPEHTGTQHVVASCRERH